MSAVESLARADERLANRINAVADAVATIGTKTAAAQERLRQAIADVREFLMRTSQDLADMLGCLANDFDTMADCSMLAAEERPCLEDAEALPAEPVEEKVQISELPAAALRNAQEAGQDAISTPDSPEVDHEEERAADAIASGETAIPGPRPQLAAALAGTAPEPSTNGKHRSGRRRRGS